jgi:hypothetical protein
MEHVNFWTFLAVFILIGWYHLSRWLSRALMLLLVAKGINKMKEEVVKKYVNKEV